MLVSSPSLIGRVEELDLLEHALAGARSGQGGTVFLISDAGLGKSRMVQECGRLAAERGMAVLRGRATAAGATVPYRPLTEALFSLVRSGGVPDDPELAPYRLALGRLIPEWRGPVHHASDDDSPVVLAESALRLLSVTGRGRGALICLSDLQDCDAETMSIIEYLVDNLAGQPVLLVASLRSAPASAALDLARSSARSRAAQVLDLGPLDHGQVGALAAACLGIGPGQLPECLLPWLAQNAEGNPFVIEELLHGAVDSGALVRTGDGWQLVEGVPDRKSVV